MSQQIKIYDTNKIDGMLNGKANSSHTHSISQVTDLQKTLDSKASISDRNFIVSIMGSDNPSSNVWYQFFEMTTSGYGNYNFLLYVSCGYQHKEAGILKVSIRSDNPTASLCDFSWLVRESETNVNNFLAHVEGNKVKLYCYNTPSQYGRTFIKVLSANDINGTPLSDSNVRTYFLNGVPIKLTAKPTFTHTSTDISHSITSVTGLQDALNSKLDVNGQAKESITIISPNGRISTPDYGATNKNRVHAQIDISSSQMTTNKPAGDGYIWTHFWDNGSWAGQLYIPTGEFDTSNCHLQWRGQNNGVWRSWEDIAWKKEVDTKANLSHKHAITDVTGLQTKLDDITNLSSRLSSLTSDVITLEQETISINTIFGDESSNSISIESFDSSARDSIQFKTINGNNIVGTGNVTISANVPTANQTTPGIYKVMTYSPVSTSNWYADDIVLTGRALQWLVNQGVLDKSGGGGGLHSITDGDYLGAYSAGTSNTKLVTLLGGSKGSFCMVWGRETRDHGHISVQRRTTFYENYECVALASGDHGYWGKSDLTLTVFIPPNTLYYLFGLNVEKVYVRYANIN